jgi:hypothetical protein
VLIDHAGRYFMVAALATLNVVLLAGLWYRRSMIRRVAGRLQAPFSYGFFIISLLVPLAVLTAIVSKSPVVGNVLLPSLLWLILLPIARFSAAKPSGAVPAGLLFGLAVVLVACSIGLSTHEYKSRNGWTARAPECSEVARLYESLAKHASREGGAKAPSISVDCVRDCLCPLAMTASIYERDRVFLDFKPQLGFGIMAVTEADAYAHVKASDFVVLSDNPSPTTSFYPFDHSMEQLRPKLRAFCDNNYTLLERVQLLDRKLLLYMRPGADASATTAQR